MGEGVYRYLGIPEAVDDSSRAVAERGSRAGAGVCELVVASISGADKLEVVGESLEEFSELVRGVVAVEDPNFDRVVEGTEVLPYHV